MRTKEIEYETAPSRLKAEATRVILNSFNVGVPLGGSVYAAFALGETRVGWIEISCVLLFLLSTGLGITLGFHRHFTHNSFQAIRPVKFLLAIAGSMAFQGPLIRWVADHRRHHRYADKNGDLHSPHFPSAVGLVGKLSGLFHAHVGWIFTEPLTPHHLYAHDLLRKSAIVLIDRTYLLWSSLSLGLPWLYGYLLGGVEHAVACLLFGGCVRAALVQNFTWSVNSFGHAYGYQSHKTKDQSRNNFIIAMLTLGEGWHNNHHAFPTSAFHGLKSDEFDLSGVVIKGLEQLGLLSEVVYPKWRTVTSAGDERLNSAEEKCRKSSLAFKEVD